MSSSAKPERLLILGGSGFLGARLSAAALGRVGELFSASRRPGATPAVGSAGLGLEPLDASLPGAAERLLERIEPDAVILCAALSRAAECERDPGLALRLNGELPQEVASWCAGRGARCLHVSTDLVFGGEDPPATGFAEEAAPAPLHEYGRSKAAGERAVLEADPAALVVRLPLLFGDSGGRGLGASDALLAALERGEQPLLFDDEWRTPLDVDEAAGALLALVQLSVSGLLHVAGAERLTRYELGRLTCRAHGRDPEEPRAGRRADLGLEASRARDASLDSSRARALLDLPLRGARAALDAPRRGR